MKVGDLVKLHPEETKLMSNSEAQLPGLVLEVSDRTEPRTIVVLWNGNNDPEEEFEDGLILINEA